MADIPASGSVGMIKTSDYLKGQGDGAGIWEDEEERRFYENLVDLKGRVTCHSLWKTPKSPRARAMKTIHPASPRQSMAPRKRLKRLTTAQLQSPTEQSEPRSIAILLRLSDLQGKDMVDQVALDFCFVNSKASRQPSGQERTGGYRKDVPTYSHSMHVWRRRSVNTCQTFCKALSLI